MQSENAIEVKNITKSFKVYMDKGHTLKEKALFSKRRKYEERKVLDDVSFEVKKGEAIGIIGHNGCGKSTTLKLLSKIMYPDSGSIIMNGRVSCLIELGAGFHMDMSGRENIYINASIFGLTRREIDARVDDIIAFSELEEYIDNPVRTYSSGMYMRLAFSVAINVDADILLIDEILAVGDANFQAKCYNKLRDIKADGVTIVIVSHSLEQIEQICERSIWLDKGKIREEGTPWEVHPIYLDYMGNKRQEEKSGKTSDKTEKENDGKKSEEKNNLGNFDVRITQARLLDKNGKESSVFQTGDFMELVVDYQREKESIKECEFGFHIFRNDGVDCYGTNTLLDKIEKVPLKQSGRISIVFESVQLLKGKYYIDLALYDEYNLTHHHRHEAVSFEIINMYEEVGISRQVHKWNFDGKEPGRR